MENPDALGYPQAAATRKIVPSGFIEINLRGAGRPGPHLVYRCSHRQIECSVDLSRQVIFGDRIAKTKLLGQLTLVTRQMAHHGSTSSRIASTQHNHGWRLFHST